MRRIMVLELLKQWESDLDKMTKKLYNIKDRDERMFVSGQKAQLQLAIGELRIWLMQDDEDNAGKKLQNSD